MNLLEILQKDAEFFAVTEIIDYSVLLGHIKGPHTAAEMSTLIQEGQESGQGIYLSRDNELYLVGIIDILTEFK